MLIYCFAGYVCWMHIFHSGTERCLSLTVICTLVVGLECLKKLTIVFVIITYLLWTFCVWSKTWL